MEIVAPGRAGAVLAARQVDGRWAEENISGLLEAEKNFKHSRNLSNHDRDLNGLFDAAEHDRHPAGLDGRAGELSPQLSWPNKLLKFDFTILVKMTVSGISLKP